jgi:hypothetical protein
VRVEGKFVFNGAGALVNAALKGLGLAYELPLRANKRLMRSTIGIIAIPKDY